MFEDAHEFVVLRESLWAGARARGQGLMQVCTVNAPSALGRMTGEFSSICYNAKGCCGGQVRSSMETSAEDKATMFEIARQSIADDDEKSVPSIG